LSFESFQPTEQKEFRGLHTAEVNQTKVPFGYSPLCSNVRFYPGGRVGTREGLTTRATPSSTNDVLGIKEYVDLVGGRNLLVLQADGTLRYETGAYSFSTVATDVVQAGVAPFLRLSSQTLFGKEWVCFGATSLFGSNPAKVFYQDGSSGSYFFDPVAPEGPANAPTAATSATAGNVTVGTHLFRIFAVTRTGYWTQLGPTVSLTVSTESKSVDIAQIPTGPSFWVKRVIVASPAFSNNFYFVPGTAMEISDNTTTTATVDFSDITLTNGTLVTNSTEPSQDLLRQENLNAPGAVTTYSGRTVWWGFRHTYRRNGDYGPLNMRFQAGYGATGTAGLPNGWTQKVSGETKATAVTGSVYGEPVRITGTGTTTQKGCLENNSQVNTWLPTGVEVWARVRAKRNSSATSGHLYTYFCPSSTAGTTVTTNQGDYAIFTAASTSEWTVVSFRVLTAAQNTGFDSTTRFRFSVGTSSANALPNGGTLDIDYIEIYTPGYDGDINTSLVKFSKVNDPEAIDGLYGLMEVEADNGEPVTDCFELDGSFYMCKDRSIYRTQDNGGEPVDWPVDRVSYTIGTTSRSGVARGDHWVVIAARSGLFFFDGRTLTPISEEIAPTWERINFTNGQPGAAQKIWTLCDTDAKRIYVGVPLDGATDPNYIIVLEWTGASPLAPDSRDYNLWTTDALCAGTSVRSTGAKAILLGDTTGRIVQVDSTATQDYGTTAIATNYRTAYFRPASERFLVGGFTAEILGSGSVTFATYGPDASTSKSYGATTLSATPNKHHEQQTQHIGEAIAINVLSTSAIWNMDRLTVWTKSEAPSGAARGHAS
jgi:hypothetical protein